MRISFEGSELRIGPGEATVLVDGSVWDARAAALAVGVVGVAKGLGFSPRVAFFSTDAVLAGVPPVEYAAEHLLARRGRYLAPLVESGLVGEESGSELTVMIAGGPIFDLCDWADALSSNEQSAVVIWLGPQTQEHSDVANVHAAGLPIEQVEGALRRLLGAESVRTVELLFRSGWPMRLPEGFTASVDSEGLLLTWEGSQPAVVAELPLGGTGDIASVRLRASYSVRSASQLELDCAVEPPPQVFWTSLAEQPERRLLEAFEAYANDDPHLCDVCGKVHQFSHALRCDFAGRSFFDDTAELAVPLGLRVSAGDFIRVRHSTSGLAVAVAQPGRAVVVEEGVLLRSSDDWIMVNSSNSTARHIGQSMPGLVELPNAAEWVIEV